MTTARKRFGQHFLEPVWAAKVAAAIAPGPDDVFIEIGPGRGALTYPLCEAAAHVVAFEIDRDLVAALRGSMKDRLTVVAGDFLDQDAESIRGTLDAATAAFREHRRVRVAGNLPYNVASPILFKLVEMQRAGLALGDLTLMVQREVADRLIAGPGSRDYGVLSILIGRHAAVKPLLQLPPGAFRPPPRVRSTLVNLTFRPAEPRARDEARFEALTKALFTRRRKTLGNALRAFPLTAHLEPAEALARAGLDGRRRPETLTVAELVHLADAFDGPA